MKVSLIDKSTRRHEKEKTTHLTPLPRSPIRIHAQRITHARRMRRIQSQRHKRTHTKHSQPRVNTPVQARAREQEQRPLPGEDEGAEGQVRDLEDGRRSDEDVEEGGVKVPGDLGTEETLERAADLDACGDEHDEARPVVLDQFAHRGGECPSRWARVFFSFLVCCARKSPIQSSDDAKSVHFLALP